MRAKNEFTRRDFLVASSGLSAAWALSLSFPLHVLPESLAEDPRVAATPLLDKGFASVRQIGRGVYATLADSSKGLQAVCNGGFLVGTDAALLFEGHMTPAGAAFELEALRLVSSVPVRVALNSHYHFDHSFGNAFYGAQGIPLWAHTRTAELLVEKYAALQGRDKATLYEPLRKRLRDATSEEERERVKKDIGVFDWIYSSVDAALIALPNRRLDPAEFPLPVDLGGLSAVLEAHPGHTPGDIIVRVPDQNIVFAGDLLFNGSYPASFDVDMKAWRAALETFAAFSPDTLFVPGHGPLCGQEGIAAQRALFDDLYEYAQRSFRAGLPLLEAQRRFQVPARFASYPIFSWNLTIEAALAKFYQEFAGKKK